MGTESRHKVAEAAASEVSRVKSSAASPVVVAPLTEAAVTMEETRLGSWWARWPRAYSRVETSMINLKITPAASRTSLNSRLHLPVQSWEVSQTCLVETRATLTRTLAIQILASQEAIVVKRPRHRTRHRLHPLQRTALPRLVNIINNEGHLHTPRRRLVNTIHRTALTVMVRHIIKANQTMATTSNIHNNNPMAPRLLATNPSMAVTTIIIKHLRRHRMIHHTETHLRNNRPASIMHLLCRLVPIHTTVSTARMVQEATQQAIGNGVWTE